MIGPGDLARLASWPFPVPGVMRVNARKVRLEEAEEEKKAEPKDDQNGEQKPEAQK